MKFKLAVSLIVLAAVSRLMPHPDNFTPIGAMGLFGAAYLGQRWMAYAVPFAALFFSDLILNNVFYREYFDGFTLITSWWIYAAFALTIALGWALLHGQAFNPTRVLTVSLLASFTFFLVTNFGHWATYNMYPKTGAGLLACYTAALPFFKNTLLGDLCYAAVLFGIYEWVANKQSAVVNAKTKI